MEPDHETPTPRTRLPGTGDSPSWTGPWPGMEAARRAGVRHVRRVSNWTAATLIAATAAAAGYFAHAAHTAPATVTASAPAASAGSAAGHQPAVSGPVATSGGSGVVVRRVGPGGKITSTIVYHGDD
jgi:hypothetical protein